VKIQRKKLASALRQMAIGAAALLLAGIVTVPVLAGYFTLPVLAAENSDDAVYSTKDGTWKKVDDNTWVVVKDATKPITEDNTIATVVKNGDQWEYSFKVADQDANYYGWEIEVPEGYQVVGKGEQKDPVEKSDGEFVIVNEKDGYEEPKTGELTLEKMVVDSSNTTPASQVFSFSITLSSTDDTLQSELAGTHVFGDVTLTNGTGMTYLKGGESITLSGIPDGIEWKIKEIGATGYTTTMTVGDNASVTSDEVSGTIATGQTVAVVCTNTKSTTPPSEKTGSFQVKKVTVNGSAGEKFKFSAALQKLKANTDYTVNVAGTTKTIHSNAAGIAYVEFELADGEIAEFTGLPIGATYQVQEEASDYTASYEITSEDSSTLHTVMSKRSNAETNQSLSTQKETLEEDENALITFTNQKPGPKTNVVELTVNKEWDDNGDAEKIHPDSIQVSLYQSTKADEIGDQIARAQLDKDSGWTYTFKDLDQYQEDGKTPYYYTVKEDPVAGYTSTSKVVKNEAGNMITVTITNTSNDESLGDLKISKTVEGANAPTDESFRFTIHLTKEVTGEDGKKTIEPVSGTFSLDNSEGKGTKTGTVYFDENGDAQISLKANESAYIKNLPAGASYEVKEETSANWISTREENSAELNGTIQKDQLTDIKVKNTWSETVALTVKKTVQGNMGNKSKAFNFTLTLTAPTGKTLPTELTSEKNESEQSETLTLTNGKCTFTLAHDESIKISGIPRGTQYSIVETGADGYDTSYAIEGKATDAINGETLITDTKVSVVNERNISVPTLASMNTLAPIGFMLAAGVVLLLLLWKYMIAPYRATRRNKK